ncbi:MAG: Tfx family DNA-binding protein [Zestosphaera sp.]
MRDEQRLYGFLTRKQYEVLKLRMEGRTQREVAEALGTTRENVSIIERNALRKVRLAEETLKTYRDLMKVGEAVVEPGTHLVTLPQRLIQLADERGVKLRGNFTAIYDYVRINASECVEGTRVTKPIKITLYRDGTYQVSEYR